MSEPVDHFRQAPQVNHYQAALLHLDLADQDQTFGVSPHVAIAQVHATLHLAKVTHQSRTRTPRRSADG